MGLIIGALLSLLGGLSATPASAAPTTAAPGPDAPGCQPPGSAVAEEQRKFHPGHYVSIGRAEVPNGIRAVLGKGVAGVQMRYRWAELEPSEGHYDFAAVARDLEAAKSANVQLVALIEDKTFKDERPTPEYLQAKQTMRNRSGGYTAVRWDPYVNDRFKQLIARLGERFDCDPNFEGVGFQETSPSLDEADLDASGYTAEKYRDALIGLLRSASASVPRSRVFWYMNFLPRNQRYIGEIASAVVGTGVVMGGPDILPDNMGLAKRVYPYYDEFQGRLKLFNSMQHNSYRHRHGGKESGGPYWSMEDLFLFARDKLHVDYIFWDYHNQRVPPDSHDFDDAREVIASHPTLQR
jgi:hypothetical protein